MAKIVVTAELRRLAHNCIDALLRDATLKAVIGFASPLSDVRKRVRVTRRMYGKQWDGEVVVRFARPNFEERKYLALCKRAKTKPLRFWLKFHGWAKP